jgi:hypothetical protein
MAKREYMTIRIDMKSKAALDIVAAERTIVTGKNVTLSDAIWFLAETGAPHVVEQIEQAKKRSAKNTKSDE